jgi:hypothetical protein
LEQQKAPKQIRASSDEESPSNKRIARKSNQPIRSTNLITINMNSDFLSSEMAAALKDQQGGQKILNAIAYTCPKMIPHAINSLPNAGRNKVSLLSCVALCSGLLWQLCI